jgi:DNA invertase Pin-like site-specific DNA recombinase
VSSNRDEAEQKSVGEQEAEGAAWAARHGVRADVFKDDDRSASTFATRQRENFDQLRKGIEAGRYKIVWFWATSRQTRGDVPLDVLADESAKHGVLWCVNGQLLNPASGDDHLILTIHYIMDRQYSARISKDSRRGHKYIAHDGKPHGPANYGYRREYERDASGQLVMVKGRPKFKRDVPDVFDGNGRPIADSPAYIVREIFDRLSRGEPVTRIARDLEDRRIPRPRKPRNPEIDPCRWTHAGVQFIAQNPFYIGKRIYQQESWRPADRRAAIIDDVTGQWDPLVSEEQFWAVQRILSGTTRGEAWRPSGSQTLLAGVARCGECHAPLQLHKNEVRKDGRAIADYYVCSHRSHVGIRVDWLDSYVEDRIVSWLADEQVWGQRPADTAVAAAARAEVEALRDKLEYARAKGEDPDEDDEYWSRRAASLARKLKEATELAGMAEPSSLPGAVAEVAGPDAADKWWKLRQENLAAARRVVKTVAGIRVHKGVHGGDRYHARIDPGRISWAWLTGPGDHHRVFGEPIPRPMHRIAEELRADPLQADHAIGRKLQCRHANVQKIRRQLEDAGEIPVIRRKGRGKPVDLGYQPRLTTK